MAFSRKTEGAVSVDTLMDSFDIQTVSGMYLMAAVLFLATVLASQYRFQNAVIASVIPGSIGAFGNIGGKGSAEILKVSIAGDNQFREGFTYVFVVGTVIALVVQNHYLQAALQHYDQVIVVPVYYCTICIFSILGGVFFFGEWKDTSPEQDLLFVLGVGTIFLGVYFLTKDHLKPGYFLAKDLGDEPLPDVPELSLSLAGGEGDEETEGPVQRRIDPKHAAQGRSGVISVAEAQAAQQRRNEAKLKANQSVTADDEEPMVVQGMHLGASSATDNFLLDDDEDISAIRNV